MKVWLQSSDLSSRDIVAVDAEVVIEAFESHDWSRERDQCEQLESQGKDNCPAGLGLVRCDGQILHICPHGDAALVHWHRPRRVLGFLWRTVVVATRDGVDLGAVSSLISSFFEQRDDALEDIVAGAA